MDQVLLQEWEEASQARENGDSEFAKTQAVLTGKVLLSEAGLPIGTRWEDIPEDIKESTFKMLREDAVHNGFSIGKKEIARQARSVIDWEFRLPERLAYKVIYESYGSTEEDTANRKQLLGQLQQVVNGEYVPQIPDRIHRRIARRVRLNKRYLIAATDLRECRGKPGYVKDTGYTRKELEEWLATHPERAEDIAATAEWWDNLIQARLATYRAFDMLVGNDLVHPNQAATSAAADLVEKAQAIHSILSVRDAWDQEDQESGVSQ